MKQIKYFRNTPKECPYFPVLNYCLFRILVARDFARNDLINDLMILLWRQAVIRSFWSETTGCKQSLFSHCYYHGESKGYCYNVDYLNIGS